MSVYSTIMRDVYEMVALSCDTVVLIDILPIRDILEAVADIIEDFDEDRFFSSCEANLDLPLDRAVRSFIVDPGGIDDEWMVFASLTDVKLVIRSLAQAMRAYRSYRADIGERHGYPIAVRAGTSYIQVYLSHSRELKFEL